MWYLYWKFKTDYFMRKYLFEMCDDDNEKKIEKFVRQFLNIRSRVIVLLNVWRGNLLKIYWIQEFKNMIFILNLIAIVYET